MPFKSALTESELRAKILPEGTAEYLVAPDVYITPGAREYLRFRGIQLKIQEQGQYGEMPRTLLSAKAGYVDAQTGASYEQKPEHMTHLRANRLVPKTHPRILFRGKLDSLEAQILCGQITALEQGYLDVMQELEEILSFVRAILSAEVREAPFAVERLLGYNSEQLRKVSHNVKEEIGIPHPTPSCKMGKLALTLNLLRTQVREAELAGIAAFSLEGEPEREDLIRALNRLSSAVYIIFCKLLAGGYYQQANTSGEKRGEKQYEW
ncbi:MAG: hypothetical protein HFG20_08690 [Anaerotruncus sp.]|nr:hypothetical protein [Anaerotruncus sp.]